MKNATKTLLITGGAGFIGSHVVLRMVQRYPNYHIINLDALTYAADLSNLEAIAHAPNYTFIKGDINDRNTVHQIFKEYPISDVLHLAAESHVDNSIANPLQFAQTNVMGTLHLLEAARKTWKPSPTMHRFYHISTDEVFGSLSDTGKFSETSPYDPRSPYSASKAASDHFVRAYHHTYQLPVVLSNCSNNYGPHQFPEKLIPLFIKNIVEENPLPVYGAGTNIRDWLYVADHAAAIDLIFHQGEIGSTYTIGGDTELRNIDLVHELIAQVDARLGRVEGHALHLLKHVEDRLGHDYRYAMDNTKITKELGWQPTTTFKEGLKATIQFYLDKYVS
jgi:dTDP-glucose 4,6-dehydratase